MTEREGVGVRVRPYNDRPGAADLPLRGAHGMRCGARHVRCAQARHVGRGRAQVHARRGERERVCARPERERARRVGRGRRARRGLHHSAEA